MAKQTIILGNGKLQALKEWQQFAGQKGNKLTANFSWTEFELDGELLLSEVLVDFLQALRIMWDKPLKVNSGYRTQAKQDALRKAGYRTATTSPHVVGMAADIDTVSVAETERLADLALRLARAFKMPIRVGFKQYLNEGQTFVHIDVCPVYYAKGGPFHDEKHPKSWEQPYLIW